MQAKPSTRSTACQCIFPPAGRLRSSARRAHARPLSSHLLLASHIFSCFTRTRRRRYLPHREALARPRAARRLTRRNTPLQYRYLTHSRLQPTVNTRLSNYPRGSSGCEDATLTPKWHTRVPRTVPRRPRMWCIGAHLRGSRRGFGLPAGASNIVICRTLCPSSVAVPGYIVSCRTPGLGRRRDLPHTTRPNLVICRTRRRYLSHVTSLFASFYVVSCRTRVCQGTSLVAARHIVTCRTPYRYLPHARAVTLSKSTYNDPALMYMFVLVHVHVRTVLLRFEQQEHRG
jgi:hypothetical protein